MHLIQHDTQTGRQFNVNTDITSQHRKYPMKKLLHQRQFSISNKVIGMGDLFSVTAQKMVCNILCYVFFFLSSETIFLSVFLLHNKSTSKEKVHRILSQDVCTYWHNQTWLITSYLPSSQMFWAFHQIRCVNTIRETDIFQAVFILSAL